MRVLCLHGCRQTVDVFSRVLRKFKSLGEKMGIEFFFLEADYDHPERGKMWFDDTLVLEDIDKLELKNINVSKVMEKVDSIVKEKNINVLLGFSQGANVVDTFISQKTKLQEPTSIEKVILFSGYSFIDPERVDIPVKCLQIGDETGDVFVPFEYSSKNYTNLEILTHSRGHKIPTQAEDVRRILKFITEN